MGKAGKLERNTAKNWRCTVRYIETREERRRDTGTLRDVDPYAERNYA
jgi:hypothetical protein